MVDSQNLCLNIYQSNLDYPSSSIHPFYGKLSAVSLPDPEITFKDSDPKIAELMGKLILWIFRELLTKPRSEKLDI